jgi:hypothetical protein
MCCYISPCMIGLNLRAYDYGITHSRGMSSESPGQECGTSARKVVLIDVIDRLSIPHCLRSGSHIFDLIICCEFVSRISKCEDVKMEKRRILKLK